MTAVEIFGSLFGTFIGAFLFYGGFYRLYALYKLKRKGRYVNGTVLRREKGHSYNTTVPFISFVDNEGNKVEGIAKNSVPTKGGIRSTGDTVKIYYDTANPNSFAIDAISDTLICCLIFLSGCLFLYAVIITLYRKLV